MMKVMMLNPIWLKTFTTLIDTGHFTKTAQKLFMTQPGVSQHIKKLEEYCGYPLIMREKKSFELTEQGRLVYQYSQQLEINEQTLLEQLSSDDPYCGTCSIACSGSLALSLYPALLNIQSQHPQLNIHIEAAPNHKILHEITSGDIELGIVTQQPNSGLFDFKTVGLENLYLIVPHRTKTTITPDDLLSLGLINHPDAQLYLSMFFTQCGDKKLAEMDTSTLPVSSYINQLNQILLPIAMGLGFTVLPKSAVDQFTSKDKLTVIQTPQTVSETLYLVKKKHRVLGARYRTIEKVITELFNQA